MSLPTHYNQRRTSRPRSHGARSPYQGQAKKKPGVTECRSCGRAVVWTRTEHGKNMLCDLAPSERGSFYLFRVKEGKREIVAAIHVRSQDPRKAKAVDKQHKRYTSHFDTCPQRQAGGR